ncbi:MAG: HD domain-containing phosphohydrolase [Candidatus Omnitrophota bacterium]
MKITPTQTVSELIDALSFAIDSDGVKNYYHSWRVAVIATEISRVLVKSQQQKIILCAGLLHDVGGVELSHHILNYLKRRDKNSINLLLSHSIIGSQLISNIHRLNEVANLVLYHHEWVNGTGYPSSKIEKYLPLGSQILRIADSIDIHLRIRNYVKLGQLKKCMLSNINKEYSEKVFNAAFKALGKSSFFPKVRKLENIPGLLKDTKNRVGSIEIPHKIDAIGRALEVVAQIIDMKHPYSSGHSLRVSRYALACSLVLKFTHDQTTLIRWAGLIHDIGKISVSRRILDKPTQLTPREFKEIRKHASFTANIMEMIPSLKDIALMASSHHEFFDGSGYPLGLRGEQIPLGSRILALCDAFDAMTSNRPYRNPLTPKAACAEIDRYSGSQFDPEISKYIIPLFRHFCI